MRIKKFIAETMQEGKLRIFKELGDDAVILSTRNVKNPSDASQDLIEIIAALDSAPVKKEQSPMVQNSTRDFSEEPSHRDEFQTSQFVQATSQIYNEIYKLKELMFDISDSVKYKYSGVLGEKFGTLYRNLRKLDFSEEYSLNLIGRISSLNQNGTYPEILAKSKELIFEKLSFSSGISKKSKRQIFSFVGPTGAGKTTSLIKLAIIAKLVMNGNVMIISTDTQKVGGAEQLQTYASIASIPFRAVYSPDELIKILTQENDKDFIFIDTTGRNPKHPDELNEINEYLESGNVDHTFLVLGSNMTKSYYLLATKEFSALGFSSILLTKADEANSLGEFFEFLDEKPIPLSYLTTGQQVPDDIEPASKEIFGKYLFKDIF